MLKNFKVLSLLTLVIVFSLCLPLSTLAENSTITYAIQYDGVFLKDSFAVTEGKEMVLPLREISEKAGFTVSWDAATQAVQLLKNDYSLTVRPKTTEVKQNGQIYTMRQPVVAVNGKLYADGGFFKDLLHLDVRRADSNRIVYINDGTWKTVVDIPDGALRTALAKKFSLPAGSDITHGDALFRINLDLSGTSIYSVVGLEQFKHLETLNLSNCYVTEIHTLSELPTLKELKLSNNRIQSVRFLDNLTNLEYLDLRNNQIHYFDYIKSLRKLKVLLIASNPYENDDLAPLYFIKSQLSEQDFGASALKEPLWDTISLRNDAPQFQLPVAPGVNWVPAITFGRSMIKNEDLQNVVLGNTPEGKSSKLSNIYELLQFLQHYNFTVIENDTLSTDASAKVQWIYPQSARQTLSTSKGSSRSLAVAVAYLQTMDYMESGVLTVVGPDMKETYLNYVRIKNSQYPGVTSTTESGYLVFESTTYLPSSTSVNALEDGLKDTYDLSSQLKGNLHYVDNLMTYVNARFGQDMTALVYTMRYEGNARVPYPEGTYVEGRGGDTKYIIFPNDDDPDTEGNDLYKLLYNNPTDRINSRFIDNNSVQPLWN